MKVKDLIPLIKSDVDLITKHNNQEICVCDNGKYDKYMLEAEVKEIFMMGYGIGIEIGYDERFFIKQKDIDKLPDTVWIMITDYDHPIVYYFKADAKKAYAEYIREKFADDDCYSKMSDDEIWDNMDEFDVDYVIKQTIIK